MFISSLHSSGPVPPCIRTDTASDYRTTFFKGPEVNVPVFCIIKVITHGGRQRLSRERGPGQTAEGLCVPARATRVSCALAPFQMFRLLAELQQTALADRKPDRRPVHGSEHVSDRAQVHETDGRETHTSDHRAAHGSQRRSQEILSL